MKFAAAIFLSCVFAPLAHASLNLNFVTCVYIHTKTGWAHSVSTSAIDRFDLAEGEARRLIGIWTSEKPHPPNNAGCERMIGTTSDESVVVEATHMQATTINDILEDCSIDGTDVTLVNQTYVHLNRGQFHEFETPWLEAPAADRLNMRTYFPLVEELDRLEQIRDQICARLRPTT